MSANFTKLKEYVNENKATTSNNNSPLNGLNDAKNTVFDFFNKNVLRSDIKTTGNIQVDSKLSDSQTDSWFRDADNDPYCPKLVFKYLTLIIYFLIFKF